jgi:alcohol dehydrogenase (cytochrome c)
LLWEYSRQLSPKIRTSAGNQLTKRNIAIYGDNLILAASDTHLIALNAKTGAVV